MKKIDVRQAGQTIIEILIAVLIVGVVLTATAVVMTSSIKNTAETRYRELATKRGQDVLEYIRKERSLNGWATTLGLFPSNANYCVLSSSWPDVSGFQVGLPGSCVATLEPGTGTNFRRRVVVSDRSASQFTAKVYVEWTVGSSATPNRSIEVAQTFKEY